MGRLRAQPGELYHLNAGEYPEEYDFPKDPAVAKRFATRGIIHSWANPDGTQKIEDMGPFGRERQQTLMPIFWWSRSDYNPAGNVPPLGYWMG